MEKETYETNKRTFSRVDAYIPLAYRLVPAEEQPYIHTEIHDQIFMENSRSLPEITDQALYAGMCILNAKLDQVLQLLSLRSKGFFSLPSKLVNISGAGLRLTTSEKFSENDILEIKTLLSVQRNRAFCLYGRIISIEEQPDGYRTSLSFIQIDDAARDEIAKFVFEREREILREKRGE